MSPWGKGCLGNILSHVFITAVCSEPFPRVLAECWERLTAAWRKRHWQICLWLNPCLELVSLPASRKIKRWKLRNFEARSPVLGSAASTGAWLLCEGSAHRVNGAILAEHIERVLPCLWQSQREPQELFWCLSKTPPPLPSIWKREQSCFLGEPLVLLQQDGKGRGLHRPERVLGGL